MASSNRDSERDADAIVELFHSLEGGLIEVYVFHANREVWKKAVKALSRLADGLEIVVDDRPVDLDHFDDISFEDGVARLLRAYVRGAEWTSTLFREDQVEFQAAPEDFADAEAVNSLVDVLQAIADAVDGEVVLIPETVRPTEATPLLSARPQRERTAGHASHS